MSLEPSTITAATTGTTGNTGPSDVVHLACECDEDRALCGTVLRGELVKDDSDCPQCVVCVDLDAFLCERCDR